MNRFFCYLEFLLLGMHLPAAGQAPQHVQDGSVRLEKKSILIIQSNPRHTVLYWAQQRLLTSRKSHF
jgi:hypothetical protein